MKISRSGHRRLIRTAFCPLSLRSRGDDKILVRIYTLTSPGMFEVTIRPLASSVVIKRAIYCLEVTGRRQHNSKFIALRVAERPFFETECAVTPCAAIMRLRSACHGTIQSRSGLTCHSIDFPLRTKTRSGANEIPLSCPDRS